MTRQAPSARAAITFGPFTLNVRERLLVKDETPLELGARTLDTLIALVSSPNEVVTKRELITQVWPDMIVEESSLRFHIANLRKVLGDGKNGARYIATLAGRGYCFVAPVSHAENHDPAAAPERPRGNLPNRLLRMVGRDANLLRISADLLATRFVTIVGPGGVGKTTVAVAVADELTEAFAGAVLFVDVGTLSDPSLIAVSIAAMLGLAAQAHDPASDLIAHLRDRRMLLVLDTCEHLVEAVATLAERLLGAGLQIHILATSREALRVGGEHIHRLQPLAVPPEDVALSASECLTFPAARLFVECAVASGAELVLDNANALVIAEICHKLDGIPLAIELAAGRVAAFGLQQTAVLLKQRLALPWQGRRNAPPRQRTLQATLDWSFDLLSTPERSVLLQLAIFVGRFTLEAALSVVIGPDADQRAVVDHIDGLVAKSMVAVRPTGAMVRYQLLDVTRAYALDLAGGRTELERVAARHAAYYRRWLEQRDPEWLAPSDTSERARCFAGLNNVRAALDWCFGEDGDAELGISLACAAAPVFLAMSFVHECHRWSERAFFALGDTHLGGWEEMRLQASLGMALMLIRGSNEAVRRALDRSLAIAESRHDVSAQLTLLGPLRMFHSRAGRFKTALDYAERSVALSRSLDDPVAIAFAHAMLGNSLFMAGELSSARTELEAALDRGPGHERPRATYFGFNSSVMAEVTLAQIAWLQGDPAEAERRARQSVTHAARTGHPVTLSVALVWTVAVFLGTGNLQAVREYVDRFLSIAEAHSLGPYLAVGRGFEGQLAIALGDPGNGVASLEDCLERLRAVHYELLITPFKISFAQGLATVGRQAGALAVADESLVQIESRGDLVYKPELLRVKASILRDMQRRNDAEACLLQSLALSRNQGAASWELRAALDLAALAVSRDRPGAATALLQPVLRRFAPGSDSADLRAAEEFLAKLDRKRPTMPPAAAR